MQKIRGHLKTPYSAEIHEFWAAPPPPTYYTDVILKEKSAGILILSEIVPSVQYNRWGVNRPSLARLKIRNLPHNLPHNCITSIKSCRRNSRSDNGVLPVNYGEGRNFEMSSEQNSSRLGFTIIEVLVYIAVFVLAMGAVSAAILQLYRTQAYTLQRADAVNEARKGVETMVKEIREATTGADGSYILSRTNDNELMFFGDIDNDGIVERVRYFRGGTANGSLSNQCVTFSAGGFCSVSFSSFASNPVSSAKVTVSVEGDFGASNEYADIDADSLGLGRICQSGCIDCAGEWQGSTTFDVTSKAQDNFIQFIADASSKVNPICNWIEPSHSMKAKFDFSWTEDLSTGATDLLKGITKPSGPQNEYQDANEETTVISRYVRNATTSPIFRYFDGGGNELAAPARPEQTTLMRVNLIINVDPGRKPDDFELESDVQIRNLKINL